MTILTPTFGDQQRIIPPHEPTQSGGWLPQQSAFVQWEAGVARPASQTERDPGNPNVQPEPFKVALIGTAPSSRLLAPFDDPSWKIWANSPGNMKALPRVDAWFEIHSNLMWPEHAAYGPAYIEWLKTLTIPVYMQDQSQVPNALSFPWKDLVDEFGEDFFTSSFAWMMAFAMKQGAAEIALYGIDMASRDEYILQRPGFYFFRHEAKRRGVKITAPNESDIMQSPPLYAICDSTPFGRKILAREQEIKSRIVSMTADRDRLSQNIVYLHGAAEDVDYFKSIWTGVATQISMLEKENAQLKAQLVAFAQRPA